MSSSECMKAAAVWLESEHSHSEAMLAVAAWLRVCAMRADGTSPVRLQEDPEEQWWHDPALKIAKAVKPW